MTSHPDADLQRAVVVVLTGPSEEIVERVRQAIADARAEGAEEGFARGYEAARANHEEDQQ
jgi:flagellar biosynthesis/type III secretory pathway protein FliH